MDQQPIQIAIVPVTPFQQNASIVWCTRTMKGAVVDPGGDLDKIHAAITETGAQIEKIVLTHGHVDHAAGAAELAESLGVPVEGPHAADQFIIDGIPDMATKYGLEGARAVTPDRYMAEGDTLKVGELDFEVLHVPGHTPADIAYTLVVDLAAKVRTLIESTAWSRDSILICGGLLGSGITLVVVRKAMEVIQTPGEAPKRIAERMRRKLDLSPDQTSRVLTILEKREQCLRSILREIEPKIEDELLKTREQVSAVLEPEQAEKWRKRFDALHERWRSRWFGTRQEKDRDTAP